jgi:hypothetical protein
MKNIADHLSDIVQNSIEAEATHINISLIFDENYFILTIQDNGKGMDQDALQRAKDPFFTTRTTRKIGIGLALLNYNCERTGGSLQIASIVDVGTQIEAVMNCRSIDMIPKGDISAAISMLICNNTTTVFHFAYQEKNIDFKISSIEISKALYPITLVNCDARKGIKELIETNIN